MKYEGHEGTDHKLERISAKLQRIISIIFVTPCAVALVAWVFVFAIYITGRTIFNVNWQFVEEFTEYWMVLISTFAFSYALWKGRHITIDIVTRRLNKRTRSILAVITTSLALFLMCYMTSQGISWFRYGFEEQLRSMTVNHTLLWPAYLLVPIGFAVLSLGLLLHFSRMVMRLMRGEEAVAKKEEG